MCQYTGRALARDSSDRLRLTCPWCPPQSHRRGSTSTTRATEERREHEQGRCEDVQELPAGDQDELDSTSSTSPTAPTCAVGPALPRRRQPPRSVQERPCLQHQRARARRHDSSQTHLEIEEQHRSCCRHTQSLAARRAGRGPLDPVTPAQRVAPPTEKTNVRFGHRGLG
jgi:hypothetical protein